MWIYSIIAFAVAVLFLVLLVIGLLQSRKHQFVAGFYFFLILIISQILSYIASPFISAYVDSLVDDNTAPPLGMTIGELAIWIGLLPRIIEVIAFAILVVGLYRMWRAKAELTRNHIED